MKRAGLRRWTEACFCCARRRQTHEEWDASRVSAPDAKNGYCPARERARRTIGVLLRALARPPHKTAAYCTSLGEKAPTPVGAHPRRVALVARRNARNNSTAVFFLPSFFFWAYMGKRKSGGRSAETQDGCCFWAEFTLASPVGRGGSRSETERAFSFPSHPLRGSSP